MRIFELFISLIGLLFLSPLFLGVAILIKATSSGPVFHRAIRVGKHGRHFRLYKFRTMIADADKHGPAITTGNDPRIMPVGCFLRRTKLDEFPQLINILKGDMALVGPRPEDPRYVALYTPQQRRLLNVKPGITSAASVVYRYEEKMLTGSDWETIYLTKILPNKLTIDLEYRARQSFWADINLVLRTLVALFQSCKHQKET